MIVDSHTQVWNSQARLGQAGATLAAAGPADEAHHREAVSPVDRAIVLGFKSRYLEAEIPNRYVADYVRRNTPKMVGFAGIDPTEPGWLDDLRTSQDELNLKGVLVAPALQDFHPADTRALRLYEECERRGLPVVFEQSLRSPAARLEFAAPVLLDEVARSFPRLKIIVAGLGYPWVDQAVVLLAKHPNVYANVAGLLRHRWLSYTALLTVCEHGVMDKLLFGSGFPQRGPAACIETLYSINQLAHGSNLPVIPREQLRGVVERDALHLLGIGSPAPAASAPRSTIFADDD